MPQKTIVTPMTKGDDFALRLPDADMWAIYPPALAAMAGGVAYLRSGDGSGYAVDGEGVATIAIVGAILRKDSDLLYADETSQESIQRNIAAALEDAGVKQIRLLVSSPGGVAVGTQELAAFIKNASAMKPMYAEVDGMAASAAYWLASATGDVRCGPSAMVGSIGVIYAHTDTSGFWANFGIKTTYITAGKYKAAGAPRALTDEDMEALQASVDHLYAAFTSSVAANMHLNVAEAQSWAEGRIFYGDQGLENGLVTSLIQDMPQLADNQRRLMMDEKTTAPSAANELQAVDMEKQKAEAVIFRENEIVAIAGIVLGEAQAEVLKAALSSGMNAEQIAVAKQLFGSMQQNGQKAEASEAALKEELLNKMEGAEPARSGAVTPKTEAEEAQAMIARLGNYGKEGK